MYATLSRTEVEIVHVHWLLLQATYRPMRRVHDAESNYKKNDRLGKGGKSVTLL